MTERIVGNRSEPRIEREPSGALLRAGGIFCAQLAVLGRTSSYVPKGVHRFRTLAEAENQRVEWLARGMAARAAARRGERA